MKADRHAGKLLVLSSHIEPNAHVADTATALALELDALRRWLTLDATVVSLRGNLARALQLESRKIQM